MLSNPYTDYTTLQDLSLYVEDTHVTQTIDATLGKIERRGKARDLLITGNGGSGKTSLLRYVVHQCDSRDIFALYLVLGADVRNLDVIDFFEWVERSIIDTVREEFDATGFRRWQDFWDRFQNFSVSFGPFNATVNARNVTGKRFVSKSLPKDFSALAQEVKELTGKKAILLLLDDADEISAPIFESFRQVFPDRGNYTLFVVSGGTLFMTGENMTLDDYNRRLLRPFSSLRIQPFNLHQIQEILVKPLYRVSTNLWFKPRHIELIHRIAKGNPYIAYSLGELCFDHGIEGNQVRLTKYIVALARINVWGVEDNLKNDQELNQIISDELDAR